MAKNKWEWYRAFYSRAMVSPAYREFCDRAFGGFLCQDGTAHVEEIDLLAEVLSLGPGHRFLELGCGSGMAAEYLAERTGASGTAVDNVPEAIALANGRMGDKGASVVFGLDDLNTLDPDSYDYDAVIAMDVLYFIDAPSLLARVWNGLPEGGRMGLLHCVAPWSQPVGSPSDLEPSNCALGRTLTGLGIDYRAIDLTHIGHRVAEAMVEAAEDLKGRLADEGNLFIFETKAAEGGFSLENHRAGVQKRYLFHAVKG